jgi:hypothetical protein
MAKPLGVSEFLTTNRKFPHKIKKKKDGAMEESRKSQQVFATCFGFFKMDSAHSDTVK